MQKIDEINKDTERKSCLVFVGLVVTLIFSFIIYLIYPFDVMKSINNLTFIKLGLFPLLVIFTIIIHELIHIFFFKLFSHGIAVIVPTWDKNLGAIVLKQTNQSIYYGKLQTLIILLSPLIIITFISVILTMVTSAKLIIFVNCILNIIGSSTDMYISIKLAFKYPNNIKVSHANGKDIGMTIYI